MDLVSITFYTIPTSIPFFRKKVFKVLVVARDCVYLTTEKLNATYSESTIHTFRTTV